MQQDQEISVGTDGTYLGERHFHCPANKGLFVKLRNCRRDSRFPAPEMPVNQVERCNSVGRIPLMFVFDILAPGILAVLNLIMNLGKGENVR